MAKPSWHPDDIFKRYAKIAKEHGFTCNEVLYVCRETKRLAHDLRLKSRWFDVRDILKSKTNEVFAARKAVEELRDDLGL